jgi:DNA-directed RNA polymerase specialized sigma24 family protein
MATVKDEEKNAKNVGPTERDAESYVSRLESVYRQYAGRVYTLCLRLLADKKAAESLTIHVFLQLDARSLGQLGGSDALPVLRELAIRYSLVLLRELDGPTEILATQSEPAHTAGEGALCLDASIFDHFIARLPASLRVAYVLHDVEGLSTAAVSGHLGVSETDVRHQIHAARVELRRLMRS